MPHNPADSQKKIFILFRVGYWSVFLTLLGVCILIASVWEREIPYFSGGGLSGAYYPNANWEGVPAQSGILDPDISRHAPTFLEFAASESAQFSVEWRGYLHIPVAGNRKFVTASDDGSWLWIDDRLVVDNGGQHGLQEKRGKIVLTAGMHLIRIRYVQYGAAAVLNVLTEIANDQMTALPAEWLFPDTRWNAFCYWMERISLNPPQLWRVFFGMVLVLLLCGSLPYWTTTPHLASVRLLIVRRIPPVLILFSLLLVGNLVIFADFIFGKYCLLFFDWGGDSVFSIWQFISANIHFFHFRNFWMHESILGNSVFTFPMMVGNIFDPLLHLIFFDATTQEIAHRMVYYVMTQSLIAGVGMYGFLRRAGRLPVSAMLGALCYACCGALTAFSTFVAIWLPPLLSGLSLILWTFKVWQQEHRWYLFMFAVVYFVLSTQAVITLYQLSVFLGIYLIYDLVVDSNSLSLSSIQYLMKLGFKTMIVGGMGVLSTGIVLVPHLYYMFFENGRYNPSSFIAFLNLPSIKELLAVWLRFFSNDLAGTADTWTEHYGDYFTPPFLYVGVLFVLVIPACYLFRGFQEQNRRKLNAITILLLPFILAMIWPGLRSYLFYGGKVNYFRWVSAFVIAAIVISGTYVLDILLTGDVTSQKRKALMTTSAILIGVLGGTYMCLSLLNWQILNPNVLLVIMMGLIGYPFLLCLSNSTMRQTFVVAVVFAELVWQGHHTVTYQRNPIQKATSSDNGYSTSAYVFLSANDTGIKLCETAGSRAICQNLQNA